MRRLLFLMTIFSSLLLSAGCGQSGPLYVPGNPSQMAVPPSQDSDSESDGEEQDGDDSSQSP